MFKEKWKWLKLSVKHSEHPFYVGTYALHDILLLHCTFEVAYFHLISFYYFLKNFMKRKWFSICLKFFFSSWELFSLALSFSTIAKFKLNSKAVEIVYSKSMLSMLFFSCYFCAHSERKSVCVILFVVIFCCRCWHLHWFI